LTTRKCILTLFIVSGMCGCASPPPDERLHSVLWVQTSAEHWAVSRQIYATAAEGLEAARDDAAWTAIIDAGTDPPLPPAIIIDVDETVLDNSGHTARAILAQRPFRPDTWQQWVAEASAPVLPGALDYLNRADELGIVVMYLTNRHVDKEPATRINLAAVGAPMGEGIDTVLTRDEKAGWGRDKVTRRIWISERYRVLQVIGDDLHDFVSLPDGVTGDERITIAERYEDRWGRYWFLIPNPMYGSWETALMQDGKSIYQSPMERKLEHLDPVQK